MRQGQPDLPEGRKAVPAVPATETTPEVPAIPGIPPFKPGTTVKGAFIRSWMSTVGECYEFVILPGEKKLSVYLDPAGRIVERGSQGGKDAEVDRYSVGALKGFMMALQNAQAEGYDGFRMRDIIEIEHTGVAKSDKYSGKDDMLQFEIRPFRP